MNGNIDDIRIEFSGDTMMVMNLCLAFLMFGVALDMTTDDFKRIILYPRSVIIGLCSQLVLLPLVTVILLWIWNPYASIALGLILVAACPGGNISNFAVHLSKGNAALSVTLTSIVTLGAIVLTPMTFSVWSKAIPETQPILARISVDALSMVKIITQLILVPLIVGMFFNYRWPKFTARIRKPVRWLSLAIFATFIAFALFTNRANITRYLHLVFALVVVHNLLAFITGYYFARSMKLSFNDAKAISMETGIQNAGLGLIIIFNFFDEVGGMMIVAAFWGVWDLLSSFTLALIWNRMASRQSANMAVS